MPQSFSEGPWHAAGQRHAGRDIEGERRTVWAVALRFECVDFAPGEGCTSHGGTMNSGSGDPASVCGWRDTVKRRCEQGDGSPVVHWIWNTVGGGPVCLAVPQISPMLQFLFFDTLTECRNRC